ncbi:FAD-dependent oxidoreductase domain-containing protein 1-like [Euwallacea similis]|uniref:FAD-dependent oxidoreductase domain-containing protein 1-like n=1 Tax=Euwallacea similis TaxID=1736056 RepID=UPI003450596A
MLLRRTFQSAGIIFLKRSFTKSAQRLNYNKRGQYENPFSRTIRVLKGDVVNTFKNIKEGPSAVIHGVPRQVDIVIIGGGAIGSSIAYWLKEKANATSFDVVVIDKDLSFSKCATSLSVGGLRQQFSLPENIQMSLFGYEFIRNLKQRFGPTADVAFTPHGYLVLASEEGAKQLIENSKLQNELGAMNVVLQKQELKDRFPWMNVDDVELGCLGLEKEGWFDPWSLLHLLKQGAEEKMTRYIQGKVIDFDFRERHDLIIEGVHQSTLHQPDSIVVKMADGTENTIQFSLCIIAAGPDSGEVSRYLKIGEGDGILSVPLPIERRKRYVFVFDCEKNPPGLNTPMTIDHTGAYFRREGLGGKFIGGISPEAGNEPETTNLDVNFNYFDEYLWPTLANRVPAFNAVKVKGAWSGFYEYNSFDENGIVGPHPFYPNIYIASGFSGHGIQQAPAIGRAVAEMVLDGQFKTIDLTRFGFDRLLVEKPLMESEII